MEIENIFESVPLSENCSRRWVPHGTSVLRKSHVIFQLEKHYFSSIIAHTYRTLKNWWVGGKPMKTQLLSSSQMNTFLPKLLVTRGFYHSKRKETRAVSFL